MEFNFYKAVQHSGWCHWQQFQRRARVVRNYSFDEDIMLSEISQAQKERGEKKNKTGWSHLHVELQKADCIQTECGKVVTKDKEVEEMGEMFVKDTKLQLKDK